MFSDRSRGRCLTSNHLLAALPNDVRQRWTTRLEWIDMPQGLVLRESGQIMRYVYFPTTAIVSLMHLTAEGDSAEIAVVGNDGLVGVALFMGSETALSRAVVETAGGQRIADDARVGRRAAGGTPRECHRGRLEVAARGSDTAFTRRHRGARPRRAGTAGMRVLCGRQE